MKSCRNYLATSTGGINLKIREQAEHRVQTVLHLTA